MTDNIKITTNYAHDYPHRAVGTGPADPAAAGPIIWQARIFMFTLYQFSRTWFDSSRIYAIRCQILMLKCTKFDFRWGCAPYTIDGFKVPTSKGREAKMEGRGRMESGEKKWGPYYYERERRKRIGGREGKRKGFAGPMWKCSLRPCHKHETTHNIRFDLPLSTNNNDKHYLPLGTCSVAEPSY